MAAGISRGLSKSSLIFAIDRDDVARSCTALRFHALPVHVRKGLKNERFA